MFAEYIFNYSFYQDGNIELEVRLTGILQVYAEDPKTPASSPFAVTLAPGVSAQYHQHLFSIRVDPMVDGLSNTVTETDVIPLPNAPTGSAINHAGNAFITKTQQITKAGEGARDYDIQLDRRWAITNPNRKHPYSGKNVGYTIMNKGAVTSLLARDDSWVAKRSGFAKKALWVVRDKEGPKGSRVWPSGKYMPQTRDTPAESITNWAKGDESINGEDILVYITMGALETIVLLR